MSYFIRSQELVDDTHPTDTGYKEMAAVWWAAVQEAEREGILEAPNEGNRTGSMAGRNGTREGRLDDGPIQDPGLPAYRAPAQPTVGGNAGPRIRIDSMVGLLCILNMISR